MNEPSNKTSQWVGPAADAGREAFQTLITSNCNPYGQGTFDRMIWWEAFIIQAQKARDDAKKRWQDIKR